MWLVFDLCAWVSTEIEILCLPTPLSVAMRKKDSRFKTLRLTRNLATRTQTRLTGILIICCGLGSGPRASNPCKLARIDRSLISSFVGSFFFFFFFLSQSILTTCSTFAWILFLRKIRWIFIQPPCIGLGQESELLVWKANLIDGVGALFLL